MKIGGGGGGGVVSALRFDDDTDHSAGRSRGRGGGSLNCLRLLGMSLYVPVFHVFSV